MWKARVLWVLWIAAALLIYIFTESRGALLVLVSSVLFPIAGIIVNRFLPAGLSAVPQMEQTAEKGEEIGGVLRVENRSVIPCSRLRVRILCRNSLTMQETEEVVSFSLSPKGREEIPFSFASRLCGRIEILADRVESRDLFGLSRAERRCGEKSRVVIYPETFQPILSVGNRMRYHAEGTEYSQVRPGADSSEVFAIREYKPGDSPKSIHWKLSQKLEKMMVRDPGLPLETSYMLLLENVFPEDMEVSPETCDCLIEVFCSVAQTMAAEGLSFCLGWTEIGSGLFTQIRVQSEEDLIPLIPQVLAAGFGRTAGSSLQRYLDGTDNQYAQVLYFATYVPGEMGELTQNTGGVQMFFCSQSEWPEALYEENVQVAAFTEENYREELGYIAV